jgi:hypothetical protein
VSIKRDGVVVEGWVEAAVTLLLLAFRFRGRSYLSYRSDDKIAPHQTVGIVPLMKSPNATTKQEQQTKKTS